jgi:hypothetical protein
MLQGIVVDLVPEAALQTNDAAEAPELPETPNVARGVRIDLLHSVAVAVECDSIGAGGGDSLLVHHADEMEGPDASSVQRGNSLDDDDAPEAVLAI